MRCFWYIVITIRGVSGPSGPYSCSCCPSFFLGAYGSTHILVIPWCSVSGIYGSTCFCCAPECCCYLTVELILLLFSDVSEHESEELSRRLLGVHGLRLPASSTRSGRKYGGRWDLASLEERRLRRRSRRTGNDQEDETGSEYSVNEIGEYKTFEKQLEYSGNASLYKERSLNHLYGKDIQKGIEKVILLLLHNIAFVTLNIR